MVGYHKALQVTLECVHEHSRITSVELSSSPALALGCGTQAFRFLAFGVCVRLVLFCVDFVLNSCLLKRFWELRKWLETLTKGKLAIALLH
jgi:hypothetical protein